MKFLKWSSEPENHFTAAAKADYCHVDGVSGALLCPRGFGDVKDAGAGGDGLGEEAAAVGHGAVYTASRSRL
jgi:hypothetical protein